jgi:hypothetical protein
MGLSADDDGWEEVPQDDGDVEMEQQQQQRQKRQRASVGSASRDSSRDSDDARRRVSVLQRLGRNK